MSSRRPNRKSQYTSLEDMISVNGFTAETEVVTVLTAVILSRRPLRTSSQFYERNSSIEE